MDEARNIRVARPERYPRRRPRRLYFGFRQLTVPTRKTQKTPGYEGTHDNYRRNLGGTRSRHRLLRRSPHLPPTTARNPAPRYGDGNGYYRPGNTRASHRYGRAYRYMLPIITYRYHPNPGRRTNRTENVHHARLPCRRRGIPAEFGRNAGLPKTADYNADHPHIQQI